MFLGFARNDSLPGIWRLFFVEVGLDLGDLVLDFLEFGLALFDELQTAAVFGNCFVGVKVGLFEPGVDVLDFGEGGLEVEGFLFGFSHY